jgi:hypothetical protein
MSNENEDLKTEKLPVIIDDGFSEDSEADDRLIQGEILSCVDGQWNYRDGKDVPADKLFIALGTTEAVQGWRNRECFYRVVKKPAQPLPNIDGLNAQVPKDQWEVGLNGPRPPYVHSFVVYLLDPADASLFTFINHTGGAAAAVRRLKDRVTWMRQLRGEKVSPVVKLGKRLHSKAYGKWGPEFVVQDWRDLSLGLSAQAAPRQIEQRQVQDPVKNIGRPVTEPVLEEILDDELPGDLRPLTKPKK